MWLSLQGIWSHWLAAIAGIAGPLTNVSKFSGFSSNNLDNGEIACFDEAPARVRD